MEQVPVAGDESEASDLHSGPTGAQASVDTPQPSWQREYISGAVTTPSSGVVIAAVINRGSHDAFVRAMVYDENGFVVQSNDSNETSMGDLVRPGALWQWGFNHIADIRRYWVRILTTSSDVVPSVQFAEYTWEPLRLTTYAYQAPGDLAVFDLPFRLPRQGPTTEPVVRQP